MAPLTMPVTPRFQDFAFQLVPNTVSHTSPLTKVSEEVAFPGARWMLRATLPPMREDEGGEEWAAFIAELEGPAGRFLAGDGRRITPRGTAASAPGTPVIDGASQTGKVLNIRGAPASAASYLLIGDYLAYEVPNGRRTLHKLTAPAGSDVGGLVAASVAPPIKESPDDGAAVALSPAQAVMKLTDDRQGEVFVDRAGFYRIAFEAEETRI